MVCDDPWHKLSCCILLSGASFLQHCRTRAKKNKEKQGKVTGKQSNTSSKLLFFKHPFCKVAMQAQEYVPLISLVRFGVDPATYAQTHVMAPHRPVMLTSRRQMVLHLLCAFDRSIRSKATPCETWQLVTVRIC